MAVAMWMGAIIISFAVIKIISHLHIASYVMLLVFTLTKSTVAYNKYDSGQITEIF